jgi:hypothetical protein
VLASPADDARALPETLLETSRGSHACWIQVLATSSKFMTTAADGGVDVHEQFFMSYGAFMCMLGLELMGEVCRSCMHCSMHAQAL